MCSWVESGGSLLWDVLTLKQLFFFFLFFFFWGGGLCNFVFSNIVPIYWYFWMNRLQYNWYLVSIVGTAGLVL